MQSNDFFSLLKSSAALVAAMLLGAVTTLASPGSALAQEASAQAPAGGAQQLFSIPAGPLGESLNRLASEAGFSLSYAPELVAGKQAPALQGEYTPENALRVLLAGSGVTYRFTGPGSVVLSAAPAGPMMVDAIRVEGWRPSRNVGYRPDWVSSASKTDAPLIETPASVAVVPEAVIRDQNARTVEEALRNVAGVGAGANAANVSVQESFSIRGFNSLLIRVNGVQRRSTGPLSLANVESVEVLKGPFSVLYGDLAPGGFVNIQTKRPQQEAAASLSLGGSAVSSGSEGFGSIDFTGPIGDGGQLLYRFIASAEGGDTFVDTAEREQYFIAPSLSYLGADDRLRLDLDLSYLKNDESFLFGIPTRDGRPDARIPLDAQLGSSENAKLTEDYSAELRGTYEVSDNTRIDSALTWHLTDHFSYALRPFGSLGQIVADDDTVRRSVSLRSYESTDLQFETNLVHEFAWGDSDWRLLFGADIRRTEFDHAGRGFANIANFDFVNVLEPNTGVSLPPTDDPAFSFFDRATQTTDTFGFYTQAEVWVTEQLKLLAGLRYTELEYVYEDAFPFRFEENPDNVDPRLGLLYKLTPAASVYLSYSSSFEQSFSFDEANSDPLEATQFEAGYKHDFLDGALSTTFSVYELVQKNLVTTNPDTLLDEQIGEARSRGFEAGLGGQLSPRTSITASYAFLDNEITQDNNGFEGNRLPNTPEHEASLWVNHALFDRASGRLEAGAGVFYEGERFTGSRNTVPLPSYTTVDAALSYSFKSGGRPMALQGGVRNLLNEDYFVSGFGEGIAFAGTPRTIYLRLDMTL
ncbi:TonB-dependent receptor [Wenzhouxiangella sp. XN24]|uniref:TonB-dependent siderophore receptor n=1 Tax=Wenzhouxiangella sp. XN24 TaxID=2713569 RepID=UPI0013EA6EC0|nr:TonB-dependent receptor [Wenzhouxiangella sp. XN24]NGX16045.1 TonB-dependent receptor [Wenzhouxiangella sp. XN24]